MSKRETIEIRIESDIVLARKAGRDLAADIGFKTIDCVKIATAISELARNIFQYANEGRITICQAMAESSKTGIEILAADSGPGIDDVDLAMSDGYSTSNGLGLGLPGTRRLVDEFEVRSKAGKGTSVRAVKWVQL